MTHRTSTLLTREPLNREQRTALKRAVDAATRAQFANDVEAEAAVGVRCVGCGCWLGSYVIGCAVCRDRVNKKVRRLNGKTPAYVIARAAELKLENMSRRGIKKRSYVRNLESAA